MKVGNGAKLWPNSTRASRPKAAAPRRARVPSPGLGTLREYRQADLKSVLLDVALRALAQHGASAIGLRRIARISGVSHATVCRYFPTKESVLATIAERGFRDLSVAMRAAAQRCNGDSPAILRATGIAYVDFGVSHPHHLQIMFGDYIRYRNDYPGLVEASAEAYGVLVSVVRTGQLVEQLVPKSEQIVALAAWSMVHGLALLTSSGQVDPWRRDHSSLAGAVLSLLMQGLAIESPSSPEARKVPPKTSP
jgi:AcrR family transcriptional regulator